MSKNIYIFVNNYYYSSDSSGNVKCLLDNKNLELVVASEMDDHVVHALVEQVAFDVASLLWMHEGSTLKLMVTNAMIDLLFDAVGM